MIGGFFGLEKISLDESFNGESSILSQWTINRQFQLFSNCRSAIVALKDSLDSKTIWLPEIFCDSFNTLNQIRTYPLDPTSFDADLNFFNRNLEFGDLVVVMDFFGKEPSDNFREYMKGRNEIIWIEDASQNLLPTFSWSDYTVFSPRKLFGVPDGGLLVKSKKTTWDVDLRHLKPIGNLSSTRTAAILRSIFSDFDDLSQFYDLYKSEESHLNFEFSEISPITVWIMKYIAVHQLADLRVRNFSTLYKSLSHLLPPEFSANLNLNSLIPFGFPIYCNDRDKIQAKLAYHKVFCAIHWRNQLSPYESNRQRNHREKQLTLPCDHRYGDSEMQRIIELVTDFGIQ